MAMTRRTFLRRSAFSGAAVASVVLASKSPLVLAASAQSYGTLINLVKCDGCTLSDTPSCVAACRTKNQARFPDPEGPIQDYWPQKKHEDWSDKKMVTNRLTPYNWTYVQHLNVIHKGKTVRVHVPRRCMHCDNPPCVALCPFGVNNKVAEGAVVIDTDGCFGGAKCRDVCPWQIPQRQAGVGIYKEIAPTFAGGGVMYKCDMCIDLVRKGQAPACVTACPNSAIEFGPREQLRQQARKWASENDGYVYGDQENGGTGTFYVSSVPFENINEAIKQQDVDGKAGRPTMEVGLGNPMNQAANMASGFLLAPIAGLIGAGLTVYKTMKGGETDEN